MKHLLKITTLLFVLYGLAQCQEDKDNTTTTSTTTTTTTSTTTTPPTTTTTTAEPNTTTTATTTTSTTTAPTTTSTAPPPTTTVIPPVDPEKKPDSTTYVVNTTGKVCLMLQMGMRFKFQFPNATGKGMNLTGYADLPWANKTTIKGTCGDVNSTKQSIEISFFDDWKLTINFNMTGSGNDKKFQANELLFDYTLSKERFPGIGNSSITGNAHNGELRYETAVNTSFQCNSEQTITEFTGAPNLLEIQTYDLQVEAFYTKGDGKFSSPMPCSADTDVSNIVPIAVGAALAALVVIVLIAYLIGRKRSKRGYESV